MANGQILPPSQASLLAGLQQIPGNLPGGNTAPIPLPNPAPAAPLVPGGPTDSSLSLGLQNLPIFQGVPPEDQRRALLAASLQLLQPRGVDSQTEIGAIGSAINTGLGNLDESRDRRQSEQDIILNRELTERRVGAEEERAAAATTAAEGGLSTAEARIAESARQFDAQLEDREAVRLLNEAKARLQDRLPEGGAGASKVNAAEVDLIQMKAKAATLFAADQGTNGAGIYSGPEDPRLWDAAFSAIAIREGQAGTENLAIVARTPEEAAGLGERIQQIADPSTAAQAPAGATPQVATPQSQTEVDALPAGTQFQWLDGKTYTKQ